eukprot:200079-Hanusia_phi.AAC.1
MEQQDLVKMLLDEVRLFILRGNETSSSGSGGSGTGRTGNSNMDHSVGAGAADERTEQSRVQTIMSLHTTGRVRIMLCQKGFSGNVLEHTK